MSLHQIDHFSIFFKLIIFFFLENVTYFSFKLSFKIAMNTISQQIFHNLKKINFSRLLKYYVLYRYISTYRYFIIGNSLTFSYLYYIVVYFTNLEELQLFVTYLFILILIMPLTKK